MDMLVGRWLRLLVGIAPLAMALAACTSASGAPQQAAQTAPQVEPLNVVRQYDVGAETHRDVPVSYVTVNVEVTDEGYVPLSIVIPVGRRVQLVMRNRGTTEHHYRVLGLVPEGMVSPAAPEDEVPAEAPTGVSDGEHEQHHSGDVAFVPSRAVTTPAGVRVTGDRVHVWAEAGGVNMVIFAATAPGTFEVSDPRHPGIVGKLVVS